MPSAIRLSTRGVATGHHTGQGVDSRFGSARAEMDGKVSAPPSLLAKGQGGQATLRTLRCIILQYSMTETTREGVRATSIHDEVGYRGGTGPGWVGNATGRAATMTASHLYYMARQYG